MITHELVSRLDRRERAPRLLDDDTCGMRASCTSVPHALHLDKAGLETSHVRVAPIKCRGLGLADEEHISILPRLHQNRLERRNLLEHGNAFSQVVGPEVVDSLPTSAQISLRVLGMGSTEDGWPVS